MKRGLIQKTTVVNDDEKYLEGINLITGDKIDYSRHILTATQVNNLCVNENIAKIDKFLSVITNGEKIQKWSLFENIPLYIENSQETERIMSLIQKNYVQYEQFINIMGEGFSKFLKRCQTNLNLINKKSYESIYRIIFRTLTNVKIHGSDILGDWMVALNLFFHLSDQNEAVTERKAKLTEFKQFINGSFSMTTLPQRRKTALQMINALIEQSQQILSQANSKILFFNNDLNPLTRLVICNIIQKILIRNNIAEIWKCVTDYYYKDKSSMIKDKAFFIMSKLYYRPNAEHIFSQFDSHEVSYKDILIKYSPLMLKTYKEEIKVEPMYQLKIFSFMNRLIRENMDLNLQRIIDCYKQLLEIIPETVLLNEIELKRFNLQNMKIICSLVDLYSCSSHIEFKDQIKKQLMKGLRYHQFYINANANNIEKIIDILDLADIQQVNVFMLMLAKQIDFSKWKNVVILLSKVSKIKFFQSHLQKMIANVLKIYTNCPYFMLEKIHQVIFQLILVDRKQMDVYIKIREKCLGSKNWMLRRNFIKMYTYFKMNGSFQFNRLITPLVYKNIVNEKNLLIKMEFVKEFFNAYSFLDPNFPQEKISIKEVISRFSQDKDKELSSLSVITLQRMKIVDRDFQSIPDKILRNKDLLNKEMLIQQVQPQQKKNIKTEKLITKQVKEGKERPEKLSMMQAKTTANLPRLSNIDKNKLIVSQKAGLTRSTSTQAKKDGKKIFIPTGYKKSRF